MKSVARISAKILPHIFHIRFALASYTRKSKTFGKIVNKMLFDGDEFIVLPKDDVAVSRRVIETDISVDNPEESTVLPSDVVKKVLMRTNDIFMMNFCICRQSTHCKDFPHDYGCIFLGKGVHKIPEEFGHIATPEEACAYIDKCGEAGLVHSMGRNKLDSVWLGVGGKKSDLMTICNCCPCCCLWNMARDISDKISSMYKRMDGVKIELDPSKCVNCGFCVEICFTKARKFVDGIMTVDEKLCRACGRCIEKCPTDCFKITYDESAVDIVANRLGLILDLKPEDKPVRN